MVDITCKNTGETRRVSKGTQIQELIEIFKPDLAYPIVGAFVNNSLREMEYEVYKPKFIEFIDLSHPIARRMYLRSAIFVLYKAIKDIFPQAILHVEHSVPGGVYCEIEGTPFEVSEDMAQAFEVRVGEIIKANLPFRRQMMPTEEVIKLYNQHLQWDKIKLFETRRDFFTSVYFLEDDINYFYGYLLPSTGYLRKLDLEFFGNGFILKNVPDAGESKPAHNFSINSKLFQTFREHKEWLEILNIRYVGDLNKAIENQQSGDIIKISEAFQEKRIAQIADVIHQRKGVKMVMISGPSSSGKTTTSKRLSVQLQVLGYNPVIIELDNYFVDRELTPLDEKGNYDFECLEAIDIVFFNQQLKSLFAGEEVEIPTFNFVSGKREFLGRKLQMKDRSILVIEGIHGLNPLLTPSVPPHQKFKIFVSALTPLSIDAQNPIPTTDNRLIRRIVRDYRYRGYSAIDTILRWGSVRRGEEQHIFPFQEEADIFFNSALVYELAILKTFAEPILRAVPEQSEAYSDASTLLKFFSYFQPMSEREIPPTSILREFLGGSSFVY